MPLTGPAEVVLGAWVATAALALACAVAHQRGRRAEAGAWHPILDRLRAERAQLRRELHDVRQETAERHRVTCGASIRLRRLQEENQALTGVATDLMRRYAAVCPAAKPAKPKTKATTGPHGRQRSNHRGRT